MLSLTRDAWEQSAASEDRGVLLPRPETYRETLGAGARLPPRSGSDPVPNFHKLSSLLRTSSRIPRSRPSLFRGAVRGARAAGKAPRGRVGCGDKLRRAGRRPSHAIDPRGTAANRAREAGCGPHARPRAHPAEPRRCGARRAPRPSSAPLPPEPTTTLGLPPPLPGGRLVRKLTSEPTSPAMSPASPAFCSG